MVADGPSTRRCGNQMVTNPSCEHLQKVLADSLKTPVCKTRGKRLAENQQASRLPEIWAQACSQLGFATTKEAPHHKDNVARALIGETGRRSERRNPYSPRSSPMKKRATVPGPVCEPMTVPMSLICTLPASAGNLASTMSRTASASSRHALIESEHLPA